MKVAVIKLGARIAFNSKSTSGGTGEAISIIKILEKANIDIDIYTKLLKKDVFPEEYTFFNIEDEYANLNSRDYDSLIIINGSVNYFGGIDSPDQTLNYNIINNFNGKVYYILCDPNLLLTQIWPSISKKDWNINYEQKDIEIVRDDIVYITQCNNTFKLRKIVNKKNILIKDIIYFPFQKFPLLTMKDEYVDFDSAVYDISYGGTMRSNKRYKKMVDYFFDYPEDIKVNIFGKIELKNFKEKDIINKSLPEFNKSVPYELFNKEMQKSLSTIIFGDKLYYDLDDHAQRIYESIKCGNIVFIDSDYDPQRRIFKHDLLRRYCYVTNIKDIVIRLNRLKNNKELFNQIVELQKADTFIDLNEYADELKMILS